MATPTPSTNTPQKHLPAFSSPLPRSGAGINYDSPAALGLSLEGGIGMGISMSGMSMTGLGLHTSSMRGRADDEERRQRLEQVLGILNKPGRVSKNGLKRLGQQEGIELIEENSLLMSYGFGHANAIDFAFDPLNDDIIRDVKLTVEGGDRPDVNFNETGGQVLLKDLSPLPGRSRINLSLERFSENLENIMRLDRLGAPDASCFHAIFGVYTSLWRLFEHEKKIAKALFDASDPDADIKAEREVLAKKSGRPRMNANNHIGLSLDYWMHRRHIIPKASKARSKDITGKLKESAMEVDSPPEYEEDPDLYKTYSMVIECESSPASMYPPIRISDAWISPEIEKPADADNIFGGPTIDWQNPPPTYLSTAGPDEHDPMNLDTPGRQPNVRFVVKFRPPLVVPLSVAMSIHQEQESEIGQDALRLTTFSGLALRPGEPDPGSTGVTGESTHEIQSESTVLIPGTSDEERKHLNSLYVTKTEYARVLDELPFSHPHQLIKLLPTLRQYAFLTSILQHTFTNPAPAPSSLTNGTSSPSPAPQPPLQIDFTLHYVQPTPRLSMHLPHPASGLSDPSMKDSGIDFDFLDAILSGSAPKEPITITLDVMNNADLVVAEQNVIPVLLASEAGDKADGKEGGDAEAAEKEVRRQDKASRIARALDVCADLGVWAEWVRAQAGLMEDEMVE